MRTLVGAALFVGAIGCGSAAKKVRPDDPTYAAAVGQTCIAGAAAPQPLIVDWQAEQRTDLEVILKQGVAVVAYDCKTLRVLTGCSLAGGYRFVGVTPKHQTLHLKTTDEVKANLPSGLIAATANAAVERGEELDIGLSISGKQVATIGAGTTNMLRGSCEGATHFVHAVTTGAFVMSTSTSATLSAEAEVATVSGTSKGASEKQWHQQDGDRNTCDAATPDALAPPVGCTAPLRMDLVGLSSPSEGAPAVETVIGQAGGCPLGLIWSGGACREPNAELPQRCRKDDAADCQAQCDRGDPGSCSDLGFMHIDGRHVPLDRQKAYGLFHRACQGGDPWGCSNLGGVLIVQDTLSNHDRDVAFTALSQACDQEPTLCTNLAVAMRDGKHISVSATKATELFSRACWGGGASACHDLGLAYNKGIGGVARDVPRAHELEVLSCQRGFQRGCASVGVNYLYGTGVSKDVAMAVRFFRHACTNKDQLGCGLLGLMEWEGGGGLSKDPKSGRERMETACRSGSADVCSILAEVLKSQGDATGAAQWNREACDGGVVSACTP